MPPSRAPRLAAVWMAALLALVLVLARSAYFVLVHVPKQRSETLASWNRELALRAADRKNTIEKWLADEFENIEVVRSYPTILELLDTTISASARGHSSDHASRILTDATRVHGDVALGVIDVSGKVVVASQGEGLEPGCLSQARESLARKIPLVDLHRSARRAAVACFAMPVFLPARKDAAAGAVVGEEDADSWLYPFLQHRSGSPGRSGEVLLAREEGSTLLFLSRLRYRPDPPLTLRRSATDPGVAALRALQARGGIGELLDYRGTPVIAAAARVRHAPWSLIVKVDREEVLGPLRKHLRDDALGWASLTLALLAVAYGIWRARESEHKLDLARSQALLSTVLQNANDAIFLFDREWRVVEVNRRAEELYGHSREELLGMRAEGFLAAGEQKGIPEIQKILKGGDSAVYEAFHVRAEGSRFPVEVSVRRVVEAGETFFVGIVRDATERKRAEEQLRKLWRAVEQSPAAVVITDTSGTIEYVNPQFSAVTGYSREEAVGQNPRILKSELTPPGVHEDLWRALRAGRTWHGEFANRRKNGEIFWEEASISPIRDDRGEITHFVGVKEDITARKQAAEDLSKTQQQLFQAQKMEAVGRLAGGVAHDFNNLLTVIQGYAELLRFSVAEGDPRHEKLDEILKASGRAAGLTRQLLAFSRRQLLEPRVLHLDFVVSDMGKMLKRLIGEDIELLLKAPVGLSPVKADPGQIEQVVLNLALNARDAMPSGGKLTISVENADLQASADGFPEAVPAGRYVLLTVTDTGTGIDTATLPHIFEPFFTTKEKGKGTGLGLSTVYGVVSQSRGHLQVVTGAGRTEFRIYLPQTEETPEPEARKPAAALPGIETILVVEDDPSVERLVRAVLERNGYKVLVASNGSEALGVAERLERPIDLLLTDVVMPGMNGRQLAGLIAARHPGTKILLMSGYTADVVTDQDAGGSLGAILRKPFTEHELTLKVREALDGAASRATGR